MGQIVNGYILPHPPIIIPAVGRGEEIKAQQTIDAINKVANEIATERPDTIILTTPHAPYFQDYAYISGGEMLFGDLGKFGRKDVHIQAENDSELADAIIRKAEAVNIDAGSLDAALRRQYSIPDSLDHGALVPLYFILPQLPDVRLVHISTPDLPLKQLYTFGKAIEEAVRESSRRVVFIASGDLSHRLNKAAPGGYHPQGAPFDEFLENAIAQGDFNAILSIDPVFMEQAGECGTRSFVILGGALHNRTLEPAVYSYEGPYGVGYMVARLLAPSTLPEKKDNSEPHTRLAREALKTYLLHETVLEVPQWVPASLREQKAGAFTTLHKNGQLRGCIGTICATQSNLAEEIIHNVISAATKDCRFPVVTSKELPEIRFSVDVLSEPEIIEGLHQLDVKIYGVIVTSGYRRGLLLPDLEGVDSPSRQVEIALQKGGISSNEAYQLERFRVIRYEEAF